MDIGLTCFLRQRAAELPMGINLCSALLCSPLCQRSRNVITRPYGKVQYLSFSASLACVANDSVNTDDTTTLSGVS